MKQRKKFKWVAHIFRGIVVGASVVSRVAASVMPVGIANQDAVNLERWNALREELKKPEASQTLPADVIDVVETADLEIGLRQAVFLSYSLAGPEDVGALDAYWVETIVRRGDSDLISQFVSMRSTLNLDHVDGESGFLDWYLWDAQSGSGDCDGSATGAGSGRDA
jgi:hypothetical protein